MPRRKMWVEWDDDADLSRSQKKPGDYSPLTRDGDNKLGHVTLSDVDEDGEGWYLDGDHDPLGHGSLSGAQEPSVLKAIIADVVNHFIDLAVAEAKPHVRKWWNEQAVPTIRSTAASTRSRLARTRKAGRRVPNDDSVRFADVVARDDGPTESVGLPEKPRARMSTGEAQQRLLAAVMARAFSDEQIRLLLGAEIGDADGPLALQDSMAQLSPQEIQRHITVMLDANPHLLDEFVRLFDGDRIVDAPGLPPGRGASRRTDAEG